MPRRPPRPPLAAACVSAALLLSPAAASAWQPTPEQMAEMQARQNGGKPGEEKKPDGEKKGDAAAAAAKVIERPTEPPKVNLGYDDRTFFNADPEGRYQFNFRGAPWPAVLTQLADVSGLSFDWQKLPADYLNLRTQRGYTAAEARDLINRHLLARGFTLLVNGEVMTVAGLADLDPAMVPDARPEELAGLPPYGVVKTVFALDWLPADKAAEELKPLLSPNGKLVPLSGTNRLLAVDAAGNLAALQALLAEEQDGRGRERLVQQFKFKHIRAEHAKTLLEDFLGISEKEEAMPKDPRQAQMMMQMRQQQAQQNGGQPAKEKPTVRLIVNQRENSILAQAPPEQMAVIERSHEALDVPSDPAEGLLRRMIEDSGPVRIYRLARLDPELFVKLLTDTGELDPMTRIEVDKKSRSLLVSAPSADHLVIGKLVEQLDGNERQFEVIKLRRLPADYVAGSIRFMMGLEEEKEDDSSSRRRSYFYSSYYGGEDEEEEEAEGQFRVDADVENNRLLLYANPVELEEIRALLTKLGEIRPEGGGRQTVRVLDVTDEQAAELLRRLERVWPRVEKNPLEIAPGTVPADDPEPQPADDGDVAVGPAAAELRVTPARLVQEKQATPPAGGETAPTSAAPPVRIRRTPDGRLELSSDDTAALDALEDLALDLTPPTKDFHVFQLEHTDYVSWIIGSLEDFFKTDEEDGEMVRDWYGDFVKTGGDDSAGRLSSRKPMTFIGDIDTRTILVQNASPAQIRQIDELLKIWDRPPEQKGGARRLTQMFNLKSAEAEEVAKTLKDVYRDLLSANDPALQNKNGKDGEGGEKTVEKVYSYFGGGGGEEEGSDREDPVRFKGLLSIGVHPESNTLVVSATETLMENVVQLVEALEQEAGRAKAASFVWQGGPGAREEIRGRLKDVFGERLTITAPGEEPVRVGAARTTGEGGE